MANIGQKKKRNRVYRHLFEYRMKIYKITEASDYLGVSINSLKTLANNGKVKSFKTTGEHRRFRQEDLDAYMGVEKDMQKIVDANEKLVKELKLCGDTTEASQK